MRIMIAFAVVAMSLCLGSANVSLGQGQDMRLPTGGTCNDCPSVGRLGDFGPRVDLSISPPPVRHEPRVLSSGPLSPSPADRDAFRDFLRNGSTGLMRLMPREIYDSETYHTKRFINIRGGGAYYSFADLTHAFGDGSDIQLERDTLSVGFAGFDYGILTNIGDVPLAEVTLKDPRTSVLANYKARKTESKARAEYRRFGQGVTIDGALYQRHLPLVVNATYLLRSIIIQPGSDVLVAFRVVRKDSDGSAIILWKRLK
jgi:hypothetical protein